MAIKKNDLHRAVNSSIIRRVSRFENTEISDKPEYTTLAPYDDPIDFLGKSKEVTNKNNIEEYDFKILSGTEMKVLKYIITLLSRDGETPPVYLSKLSLTLGNPISTLKKMFQKLEIKGLLIRVQYKSGRGGWTIYSINKEIKNKLEKF